MLLQLKITITHWIGSWKDKIIIFGPSLSLSLSLSLFPCQVQLQSDLFLPPSEGEIILYQFSSNPHHRPTPTFLPLRRSARAPWLECKLYERRDKEYDSILSSPKFKTLVKWLLTRQWSRKTWRKWFLKHFMLLLLMKRQRTNFKTLFCFSNWIY